MHMLLSLNCVLIFRLSTIFLWVLILTAGKLFIKKKLNERPNELVHFSKARERERVLLKKNTNVNEFLF